MVGVLGWQGWSRICTLAGLNDEHIYSLLFSKSHKHLFCIFLADK
jgi:hypothetical protein